MRKVLLITIISIVGGFTGAFLFFNFFTGQAPVSVTQTSSPRGSQLQVFSASPRGTIPLPSPDNNSNDFVKAAEQSRNSVAFIRGESNQQRNSSGWDMLFDFFYQPGPVSSFGSGVIISKDGYIVTNNHVIEGAEKLEVIISNSRTPFPAKIVGTDPSTDLAVLKIEASNLNDIQFGNSEELNIGEWVLAVGNPFNLTSTVTAGIVSAKGRNINIVRNQLPIESFIQTDAAINPGNSGGALVNLDGELVGLNTAIMSKTGSYAGYGFAIPSNIVRKIAEDIIRFGIVQRAFIEAEVRDLVETQIPKNFPDEKNGIFVTHVVEKGSAARSGINKGDIITEVNKKEVTSRARFDEILAYHRPGDKVNLEVFRDGRLFDLEVVLTNNMGTTELVKNTAVNSDYLGAHFIPLSKVEKDKYGIEYGVRVTDIRGGLIARLSIPEGFTIISVNNQPFSSAEELITVLEKVKGRIVIKGFTLDGNLRSYSAFIY